MDEDNIVVLECVSKNFILGNQVLTALNNVSFSIKRGTFLAIMGPSGSGKSTLLQILGCLDNPTSGNYFLDNDMVADKLPFELSDIRNSKIGFVFQNFNLLPKNSAIENVELPLIYAGVNSIARKQEAKKMMELVGLQDREEHKPNQLSGGQRQRVAIARALINNPAIILADEPTGNLDSKSSDDIMDLLQTINKQGRTLIMVTHDESIAKKADRIICLKDGMVVSDLCHN